MLRRPRLNYNTDEAAHLKELPSDPPPPYTEKPSLSGNEHPQKFSISQLNLLAGLFASSQKIKLDPASSTLVSKLAAASQQPLNASPKSQQPLSLSLPLPSISLSNSQDDAQPTTIWSPPSDAEARRIAREHAQFGPIGHASHQYSSRQVGKDFPKPINDEPPYLILLTTYISYLILIVFGHVRDFFGKRFAPHRYRHLQARDGYGPLENDFDSFYTRRLKLRLDDCFARPVTGVPGRYITLLDRQSNDANKRFYLTGSTTQTLNMSSYNYLGFAQSEGPCADFVEDQIRKCGISVASPRADVGTTELHLEVERVIADFLGKEAAMVFSMGFGTNAAAFPALVGPGCLVISDELNHASIRFGTRLSGAVITLFKHNDMKSLEKVLREAITQGQPRTHRPWRKILVVVEGLYSMEGTMCNLPGLVRLKRKYKFNLFVDEAHSIGAIGPRGRGVCDYFNINPGEVDILMGTLTKSFGANGGYVAADRAVIEKLRVTNAGSIYGESPAPPVLAQILSSLKIITGESTPGQGEERLQRLAFNSRYVRLGLKRLGFIVYGHDDSPIIPLLLYHPAKMSAFSHEALKRKISVVVVGYPATPLVSSRARFCVSAAHTKDDLDRLLRACDEIGGLLHLKFSSGIAGGRLPLAHGMESDIEHEWQRGSSLVEAQTYQKPRWTLEDVIKHGVRDVKSPLR